MDQIILSGIEVYAYGGVTDAEKSIGQRYRVDVELGMDLARAGDSDAIQDTVHYGHVHAAVVGALRDAPFNLIERAATRIAERLLREFPVVEVRVRLAKLLPPIDGTVASAAVEITRSRAVPG